MCDYSLEMYASRPAREGERYVTERFPSGSLGLVSPGDARTAICLNCDTPLALTNLPDQLQRSLGVPPSISAIFARLDTGPYRDAITLPNGRTVSLQLLGPGVIVSLAPRTNADRTPDEMARPKCEMEATL